MQTQVKVAGTTFHPLPEGEFLKVKNTYTFEGVSCADADCILVPEPTNPHDPEAVMVIVPLDSGNPFHIGYLPKDSSLKRLVTHSYAGTVMVKNFALSNPQYSASWIITEVVGL